MLIQAVIVRDVLVLVQDVQILVMEVAPTIAIGSASCHVVLFVGVCVYKPALILVTMIVHSTALFVVVLTVCVIVDMIAERTVLVIVLLSVPMGAQDFVSQGVVSHVQQTVGITVVVDAHRDAVVDASVVVSMTVLANACLVMLSQHVMTVQELVLVATQLA